MKKYLIFAGVNGAGKSTLYGIDESPRLLKRVNTDEIVREFGSWKRMDDEIKAGRIAIERIRDCFCNGESLCQETTLCGNSILRNIKKAKELGYYIEVRYVGVESSEIAKHRIAHRVETGGHGIPDEDVERRYKESFEKLIQVIPFCDRVVLYDNSKYFYRFAIFENGKLIQVFQDRPEWFEKLGFITGE